MESSAHGDLAFLGIDSEATSRKGVRKVVGQIEHEVWSILGVPGEAFEARAARRGDFDLEGIIERGGKVAWCRDCRIEVRNEDGLEISSDIRSQA